MTPDDVRELRADAGSRPFTIVVGGRRRRDDERAERDYVAALAEAGADWWQEYLSPETPLEAARDHIARGPLRG